MNNQKYPVSVKTVCIKLQYSTNILIAEVHRTRLSAFSYVQRYED